MVWLFEPGPAIGSWFKTTARAAVVVLAGIPISIVRFGSAGIHQRPALRVGSVPQAEIGARIKRSSIHSRG